MLDQVIEALEAIEGEGSFAVEHRCKPADLHIEAAGIGPITFPISAATAQRLRAIARPAPFGKRDKTLHDPKVRDTWEIEARLIKIDEPRWRRTLGPLLAEIRRELGLPGAGELVATLDKMLVYGPGQFFATHQDSERSDDMVGSLVVTLPSSFSGGAVVVEHRKSKKVFRADKLGKKGLSLLAFYADCHHRVEPVTSGFRVVLTYHLRFAVDEGREATESLAAASLDRLAKVVREHFATPVARPYFRTEPQIPDRLIYLLDHEYTQKSLDWGRLKNGDRLRASALRRVAAQLDCECFLALADVHEIWQCEEEWGGGYGRSSRGRRHAEEDDMHEDEDGRALVDLVSTDIELRHWIGADGHARKGHSLVVSDGDVCFTEASVDMAPFKSEYEGYTGNYGNTVDRWYHRAAVVLWPREREFVIRAKVSPSWAVSQVSSLLGKGKVEEAREKARSLLPFWGVALRSEQDKTFLRELVSALVALREADLSLGLLTPFGVDCLGPHTAASFVALVEAHGLAWAKELFTRWAARHFRASSRWVTFLPRFCEVLLSSPRKRAAGLAEWLLSREVTSFKEERRADVAPGDFGAQELSSEDLDELIALFDAAQVIGAQAIRDDLLAFLTARETGLRVETAGALLRKCRKDRTPAALRALGLGPLVRHVEAELKRILAKPARSPEDWSIEPPMRCKCDLCHTLSVFLKDREQIEHAWPLAKDGRQHVHQILDGHGLPVTHLTTRRGRPYTLVLKKQPALFERAATQRKAQEALRDWIKQERKALLGSVGPRVRPN
ncbi:MAG: 2OG-Fe(II) oxygenase [Polyangiaceae bacterium]